MLFNSARKRTEPSPPPRRAQAGDPWQPLFIREVCEDGERLFQAANSAARRMHEAASKAAAVAGTKHPEEFAALLCLAGNELSSAKLAWDEYCRHLDEHACRTRANRLVAG